MDSNIELHTFPKDADEALALLYLQNLDLSKFSPEQLYDKYEETRDRIHKHHTGNGHGQKMSC